MSSAIQKMETPFHDYEWKWIRAEQPPQPGKYLVYDPILLPEPKEMEWDGHNWVGFGDIHYPYRTTLWNYIVK
jgi:hypothetical protein